MTKDLLTTDPNRTLNNMVWGSVDTSENQTILQQTQIERKDQHERVPNMYFKQLNLYQCTHQYIGQDLVLCTHALPRDYLLLGNQGPCSNLNSYVIPERGGLLDQQGCHHLPSISTFPMVHPHPMMSRNPSTTLALIKHYSNPPRTTNPKLAASGLEQSEEHQTVTVAIDRLA